MELKVEEIKALAPLQFNYEELKANLTAKVETYKSMVYTDENIKVAKSDRALLNKLKKAINDEKIRVVKELRDIYKIDEFESKCKELISIIDDANKNVDTQVKAYEQNIKDEKLKEIMNFFIENVGEYEELINFDKIFNERWLNATYKMEQIQKDILHIFTKTKTDLNVIDTQFTDEIINKQVKMSYFNNIADTNVLTLAILDGNKIIENNKRLEELKQQQEAKKQENNAQVNTQVSGQVSEQVAETEKLTELAFRVWVTDEQKILFKNFMKENKIKGEMINLNERRN